MIKKSFTWAMSITTVAFTFLPEAIFKLYKLNSHISDEVNILCNRSILFIVIWLISLIICSIYLSTRQRVEIKGKNYSIVVSYGDIFKQKNGKKVIPFDECFTTTVGNAPSDINPRSICGQYLLANPTLNLPAIISASSSHIKGKSKFQGNVRYESGTIVPNQDFLLMAFAKLDKDGLGRMTKDEYIESLSLLWKEIDKYYGQEDVYIPVIGSGVTRIGDVSLTQQECLDIIIASYRLSSSKIKKPNKLCIVCQKRNDFSINKIDSIY